MNNLLSKLILLVFFVTLSFESLIGGNKTRTYNKENVEIKDYPFMVIVGSKLHTDNSSLCAGTIIHPKFVITAAKCISKCRCLEESENRKKIVKCMRYNCELVELEMIWIQTGSTIGHERRAIQKDKVHKLFYHPLYDGNHRFDVGLIKVKNTIDISYKENIPLKLPKPRDVIPSNVTAFTLGRGLTDNPINAALQRVNLNILSNDQCERIIKLAELSLEDSHVCAEFTSDTCFVETGAPLIYDNKLHGIATFPVSVDCASDVPSLFLRLPLALDWIAYALIYL